MQLLPLGLGIALRRASAPIAGRIEPWFQRVAMAMLVATIVIVLTTLNAGPPQVSAAVLAYLVVSVLAIVPYGAWRRYGA